MLKSSGSTKSAILVSLQRYHLLLLVVSSILCTTVSATQQSIMVLHFELNDLTSQQPDSIESERTTTIKPMLEQALQIDSRQVIEFDPVLQQRVDHGHGYLYDHISVAAKLGREVNARWVIVGRVHKPSYLFLYLKVHLINVVNSRLAADLAVEVKGSADNLLKHGVERLAEQIGEAIDFYSQKPKNQT